MKKIFLTGATGFIGANLAHKLVKNKNNHVYVLVRKYSNLWRISKIKKDVILVECDLNDGKKLKEIIQKIKPSIIYHCAAYGIIHEENDFEKTINTNVFGTINLINACKDIKIDAFINLSSSLEYGEKEYAMKECDSLNPINIYGISKVICTEYANQMSKVFGLPIITLRVFTPFGYYEHKSRLFPSLFLSIVNNKNPQLAKPNSVRDFIFIEDAIDFIILSSKYAKKYAGQVFNLGTGKQHSVSEIADLAINVSGKKLKPEYNSVPGRIYDLMTWTADMKKTFKYFNWKPRYSIKIATKKMFIWFSKNKKLYSERNNKK